MKYRGAILGMALATTIFGVLLVFGILNVDPRTAHWLQMAGVTAALALFLWSFFGTALLGHRRWRKKDVPVLMSLRQASFLSILVVCALYLQRFNLLTWWNIALMVGAVVLLEMFFIGKQDLNNGGTDT